MIDPIGAPAGIVALAIFVFNVTVALQQALKDIHNYPNEIVELRVELDDVQKVLSFLRKAASHNADDLLELESLLSHCGQACQDFLKIITKCSTETKGKRAVLISWTRLQIAKSDIMRLRNILSQVKSTTSLTLGGINLQRFAITAAALEDYQRIVTSAMVETQHNLHQIKSQLESFSNHHPQTDDQDIEKWKQLQASKRQCENDLHAFSGVLALLEEVELDKLDTILNNPDTHQAIRTTLERPTKEQLCITDIQEFIEKVPQAISHLESHLSSIEKKMRRISKAGLETQQTLEADKQADERCLHLLRQCNDKANQKRPNIFKDIRAAERAHQAIISNVGQLLHCENISAGPSAMQLFGQCSDESFQRFWSGETTTSSNNGKVSRNDASQKSEWIAWHFAALCASSGFVAWIVNRGLT